jgi:hypothetical protein
MEVGIRVSAGNGSLAQFVSHSLPFTAVHGGRGPPVRAGQGRSRPVVNGGAQSSKACEGATLPWVQIPPPPPLTRHVRDLGGRALPAREAFVSVFGHKTAVVPGQGRVSCLRIVPLAAHSAYAGSWHLHGGVRRHSLRLRPLHTRAPRRSQSVVGTSATGARRTAVRYLGCSCGRWAEVACIAGVLRVRGRVACAAGCSGSARAGCGGSIPARHDKRTLLRFSRISIARCADLVRSSASAWGPVSWSFHPITAARATGRPPCRRGPSALAAQAVRRTGLACPLRNRPVAGITRPPVSAPCLAPDPAPSCGPGRRGWPGERRCDRIAG